MSIKIIYGAYPFGKYSAEENKKYLDILSEHGVKDLDTAHVYVRPEPMCQCGWRS